MVLIHQPGGQQRDGGEGKLLVEVMFDRWEGQLFYRFRE